MERKIVFAPNEYYHIYNRGVEKRKIFADAHDYDRFLKLLYLCNGLKQVVVKDIKLKDSFDFDVVSKIVSVGAYVLMPNHFHILIRLNSDAVGVTQFLRKLTTGYTMYFNKKYQRVGPLFQGVFKAEHVADDVYLKYLYSYIHLNPVKIIDKNWKENITNNSEMKNLDFAKTYPYSSFPDYLETKRPQSKILSKESFPDYFLSELDSIDSLQDWLNLPKVSPREEGI